ncbi:hypothetical protein JKF63_01135 [Porcisia hertigi]|uniref:Uncharacterized protein n=1 Tax=Porcisia hertigi TaxID=2761500 RepID=A0A836HU52_9TRYP|nr:hypothetical protein JKF63_01135 [Porcisia hertigi]
MLSTLRLPVHEGVVVDKAQIACISDEGLPASPRPRVASPFRCGTPSMASLFRAGSISSENVPPPSVIQHIEGRLWYVTGKYGPGKRNSSAQWVICEDHRLSVYSSWAKSSRLVEEVRFERVRIIFNFLHRHKHPHEMGSCAPETRRLTIHRNEPRTAAESRYVFQVRDQPPTAVLGGYYYFGVECSMRDSVSDTLHRNFAIFCTDHSDDHRQWLGFWEEMQLRYPMLRNRDVRAVSMDMSTMISSEFVFPQPAASLIEEEQCTSDTDTASNSELPSSIHRDDDSLAATHAPRLTDSEHELPPPKGSMLPPSFTLRASADVNDGHRSLQGYFHGDDEGIEAGGVDQWTTLITDAERQARDGIELMEAATRSLLGANQMLRSFVHHVASTATPLPSVALESGKSEDPTGDGSEGDVVLRDDCTIGALQTELKALCASLNIAETHCAGPAAGCTGEENQVLAAYERELAELRDQNAALRNELDTSLATVTRHVEKALEKWILTDDVDLADSDAGSGGSHTGGVELVSPVGRQRYLAADEALVRALVDAAFDRKSSAAVFASSGGFPTYAKINTQDESAFGLQASYPAIPTGTDVCEEVVTTGYSLGTASVSPQAWRAPDSDAHHSDTSNAAGALAASPPALVQQHLSTFALEHARRLGGDDSASSVSADRDFLLYYVMEEVVAAFNRLVEVPSRATCVSNTNGGVSASSSLATAVSSWLSVLNRCLLRNINGAGAVSDADTSTQIPLAAADISGSAECTSCPVDSAAAGDGASQNGSSADVSSFMRQTRTRAPLTDEGAAIVSDFHRTVQDVVVWILHLQREQQRHVAYVATLDGLTCQYDLFRPLKVIEGELERAATCAQSAAAAAKSARDTECSHNEGASPDTRALTAVPVSGVSDDGYEDAESHPGQGPDARDVEGCLKARLQHAVDVFDSKCKEASALRRLLTTILYGNAAVLQCPDSSDEIAAASTMSAAAACEAFRAAKDAGIGDLDKLRDTAEASVAARAREEMWANTLTPAVLQACADALIGASCVQDLVRSLQLTLGRCPEAGGLPAWDEGTVQVPPLSQHNLCGLVQELHQCLATEQAGCDQLLNGVMRIFTSIGSCERERVAAAACSTAMATTTNAEAVKTDSSHVWEAYKYSANETQGGQQRSLDEPVKTASKPYCASPPAQTEADSESEPHRSASGAVVPLMQRLSASIASTQAALRHLVGILLRHGVGAGASLSEALLVLPTVNHMGSPNIHSFEQDGTSPSGCAGVLAGAFEDLLKRSEEAASERREWIRQLFCWIKDFHLAFADDTAPTGALGPLCDMSTALAAYDQLLEELSSTQSQYLSRVDAVEALLGTTNCACIISAPEIGDGMGHADTAVLAAAAEADIAEALHASRVHISVPAASFDRFQRLVRVNVIIVHDAHRLTWASLASAIRDCPCTRLREVLKGATLDFVATTLDSHQEHIPHPTIVDTPESISTVENLVQSMQHRAAKMSAILSFEQKILALLPSPPEAAVRHPTLPTANDPRLACEAENSSIDMPGTTHSTEHRSDHFHQPDSAALSPPVTLDSSIPRFPAASPPPLQYQCAGSAQAPLSMQHSAEELHLTVLADEPQTVVDSLRSGHDTARSRSTAFSTATAGSPQHIIPHSLAHTPNIVPSSHLNSPHRQDLCYFPEKLEVPPAAAQLAECADAVVSTRAEDAEGLRRIAEALGMAPDAYAGEYDGTPVPTAAQLAECADAVVSTRAEDAEGLRRIAEALGMAPDAYAGEYDGTPVPTAAQLAECAGAVVSTRAEDAEGLRRIAEALGMAPDAYAGEYDGTPVPTAAQLAECVGAVVSTRAEDVGGDSRTGPSGSGGAEPVQVCTKGLADSGMRYMMDVDEMEAALGVLVALGDVMEGAGVVSGVAEEGWWRCSGRGRWEAGARLVRQLSTAVGESREELGEFTERMKQVEDQLSDMEHDHKESCETIAAALEKLRSGLGEVDLENAGEVSPPSSSRSTVCGTLYASLRQLTSEVSEVTLALRRVKVLLDEHNAEEKRMTHLEEMSFPVAHQDGGDTLLAGLVVTYEDVVAGVHAKVDALKRERERRAAMETVLRNFLSAVFDGETAFEEEVSPCALSFSPQRSVEGRERMAPGDSNASVSGESSLPRLRCLLPSCSGNADSQLGGNDRSFATQSLGGVTDALEKVCRQTKQAENAIATLRAAVAATWKALGGEDDAAHTSDSEAGRLLVELAQSIADSLGSFTSLLEPLERSDSTTSGREPLAHLIDRIKEKFCSSLGRLMPTQSLTKGEEVPLIYNEVISTGRSPRSSLNRHLPRKQKPVAPELVCAESFHLSQQVVHNNGSFFSSATAMLKVRPLPPPEPPVSAEDLRRETEYRMEELDVLRKGCGAALGILDPSLQVSDMDCNTMVMHLAGHCTDVQAAIQITDAIFEDDMILGVSTAAATYKANHPSADEDSLSARCSVLVGVLKSFANLCESLQQTQANMEKQQRFLMDNEDQQTSELRHALMELEEQLHDSNAVRIESQKAREAAEERAAELSSALEVAQSELADLQRVRDDLEESRVQLRQQHDDDAGELHYIEERLTSLSSDVIALQRMLEEASNVVHQQLLGLCQRLHLTLLGKEASKPGVLAESKAQETLLPTLHAIVTTLQSAVDELASFSTEGKRISVMVSEERIQAAHQAAALKGQLAAVTEAKEETEAAAKHLRQAKDTLENEVETLNRALRKSAAMLEDEETNHQRQLRQVQVTAEDLLAVLQKRLDHATCAHREEKRLRAASDDNVQRLRAALAEMKSALTRQKRCVSEEAMTQREVSARRIASLEADISAARLRIDELAHTLRCATDDKGKAERALEAETQVRAKLVAELAEAHVQLRAGSDVLSSICASIVSTGLVPSTTSSAPLSALLVKAPELLAAVLGHLEMLQSASEARKAARQQRQNRGIQCEGVVVETLAAFSDIWAAAVKTGRTPARLNEAWLTPTDKAEVVMSVLEHSDSPQLEDLAATRQRLLVLLCHQRVSHQVRSAALGSLEHVTTATLLEAYHDVLEGHYESRQAALEQELSSAQSKAQNLLARLQEQEEQHAAETEAMEIQIGHMRQMVQKKIIADEIAEQQLRETSAAAAVLPVL